MGEVIQFRRRSFQDELSDIVRKRGYTVERELGRGSFGIAYEVESVHGDPLCLKVLAVPGEEKPQVLEAVQLLGVAGILEREKYAQKIRHHNIVHVSESFSAVIQGVDVPLIICELIKGETLEERLVKSKSLSKKEFHDYAFGLAGGVAAMHKEWIVNRDIKADNIMCDSHFNRPVIFDFGLGEIIDDEGKVQTDPLPQPSSRFSAPELETVPVSPDLDHRRCDIWALGVVFYHMLTGKNPKKESKETGVSFHSLIKNNVPRRYHNLISHCLEEDPKNRFPDGTAVVKALKRADWYYALHVGIPAVASSFVALGGTLAYLYLVDVLHTFNLNVCKKAVEVHADFANGEHACTVALKYKEDSAAYLYLGHSLLEQGKYDAAKIAYKNASPKDYIRFKDSVSSFVVQELKRKELELESLGKTKHAIAALEILIDLDKQQSELYYPSLAHLLIAEERYEDAGAFLRLFSDSLFKIKIEKIEIPKMYPDDITTVALLYKEQGKGEDALYFAEMALKSRLWTKDKKTSFVSGLGVTNDITYDPSIADSYFLIGDIHFKSKQYEKAFAAYYEGNKISPTKPEVFVNIATIWIEEKNYKGAREILVRARHLYFNKLESTRIELKTALEKQPTAHIEYDPLITGLETKITDITIQLSHIPK